MFGGASTTTDYLSRVFILHQYRVSLTWPGLVFYMRIADSDTCSSHGSFDTYRRKCTGALYVRLFGTWYRRDSDTRSCCESVQTRRIPYSSSGSSCILSHAKNKCPNQQSHIARNTVMMRSDVLKSPHLCAMHAAPARTKRQGQSIVRSTNAQRAKAN